MSTPKFVFNGVRQCWHCKNHQGNGEHIIDGYSFLMPYCRVCDADMTEVYDYPCRGFESDGTGSPMTCLDAADNEGGE